MRMSRSPAIERRSSARRPATGGVRLRAASVLTPSFMGRVIDVAETGFRARHGELNMTSGQVVEFELAGKTGYARAVWTRIVDGEAETGFHILPGAEG